MSDGMKKFILWIGMLLFLGITVSGTLAMNLKKMDIHYHKVNVKVTDVEVIMPKDTTDTLKYIIKVQHNGEEKELKNVKMGFSYRAGNWVEVYEAHGQLYEDEDGVRTDSTLATYYFASLGINLVLIFLLVYGIAAYRRGRW